MDFFVSVHGIAFCFPVLNTVVCFDRLSIIYRPKKCLAASPIPKETKDTPKQIVNIS